MAEQWRHLIGMEGRVHLETSEPEEIDADHTYVVAESASGEPHYEVDGVHIKHGETVEVGGHGFRVRAGDRGE